MEQARSGALDMAEHAACPGSMGVDVGDIVTGEDATHRGVVAVGDKVVIVGATSPGERLEVQ